MTGGLRNGEFLVSIRCDTEAKYKKLSQARGRFFLLAAIIFYMHVASPLAAVRLQTTSRVAHSQNHQSGKMAKEDSTHLEGFH
ncbi:hypothetical protein PM082_016771 [Marasmius tenuissimus]|nr:hypothetical protein PM082_016771 [Marasmius tenuissimus]